MFLPAKLPNRIQACLPLLIACLSTAAIVFFGGFSMADSGGVLTPASSHGVFLGERGKPSDVGKTNPTPCIPNDRFLASIPFGIDVRDNNVWMTTVGDHRVWQTTAVASPNQQVCHVAGNGQQGYSGDGGLAVDAKFNWPHEVRADKDGNLWIADTRNHAIRHIDKKSGIVTTLAGNGENGFAGDGQSGNSVRFDQPHSIVLDRAGGLLVADTKNHRLRRIDLKTGIIRTVCGTGEGTLPIDGADAATSPLFGPRSLAVDEDSIWIAMREGNSIWRIDRSMNTIHHVAGTGKKGYGGDGGTMLEATFSGPKGIVLSGDGSLAVVDTENHAIRRIDLLARTVTTILGGSRAKETLAMKRPHGIAFAPNLGLLVADSENDRIVFIGNH